MQLLESLKATIRDVPDFPKPGILFKDITPVLMNQPLFLSTLDAMSAPWRDQKIDVVAAIESRGFIFGASIAHDLKASMVLVRKAGKLPYKTVRKSYALEYGEATLELHIDAVKPGDRVLIVDDLLATGGTADAARHLVEAQGGVVAGYQFVIGLAALGGAQRLGVDRINSLVTY